METEFSFGDRELEGQIVDAELVASYNSSPEYEFAIDVDGNIYRAREADVDLD